MTQDYNLCHWLCTRQLWLKLMIIHLSSVMCNLFVFALINYQCSKVMEKSQVNY